MHDPSHHVPLSELTRFAESPDPEQASFDWVRDHLALACVICCGIVDDMRDRRSASERARTLCAPVWDWIMPRRGGDDGVITCEAGPYLVDMVVSVAEDDQDVVRITGTIVQNTPEDGPAAGLEIVLVDPIEAEVRGATISDDTGEFEIRTETWERLGLRLGPGATAPCILVRDTVQH